MTASTLLFPVDPTGCAFEVAARTAPLAKDLGAEVVLLHVAQLPEGVEASTPLYGQAAMDLLDNEARDLMRQLCAVFKDEGVQARALLRHGDVVPSILAEATALQPRFLVLGTHGRKGLERLFMGSVAESVMRQADVPVLTVRTQTPDSHPGPTLVQAQLDAETMG
jgi:nucleotide-binding universal stress UspA family protein